MADLTSLPSRFVVPAVIGPGYPTLRFDITNPVQTDFLGIGAVNMAFMEFAEYGLTTPQKTAEYDRARTSGLRMARTAVKTDWAMPTFPAGAADWTGTGMVNLYAWLQAMKDREINVVLTTGWHFPGSVCDIDLNGVTPTCVPGASDENAWKQWVSDLLHQTMNVRGFTNIVACFFFTEPNNTVADPSATDPSIPNGYTAGQYYGHLVTIARAQIAADDASRTPILPRVKLIGTEEHSLANDTWLEYVIADSGGVQYDAFAAHSYEDIPEFGPLGLTATNSPDFATYLARWQNWRADVGAKDIWSDEWNALVGGDPDSTGYRQTADAGMRMGRGLVAQIKAGVQAPFIWTLRDEHFEGTGGYSQNYGITDWPPSTAVRPSWYCVSMLANLCGGGTGTKVYDVVGGETSALHAIAVFVPFGDRWSTGAAGDWTFVVVNDGDIAQPISVLFNTTLNRTFYRYTYSGEHVPVSAADPAYVLPWDQKYPSCTTGIPANVIPARSVVCYSTMVPAAGADNLALTATASTDSTGYGQASNVLRGNRSNVLGVYNSWRKANDASHYVQATWASAVTLSRIELAFVGTTAGVVWADGLTAATPDPLADYTIEYWNGSTWVEVVSVTGNALPNRSHTITPVTTTAIRLNASSAAATAAVNNIAAFAT